MKNNDQSAYRACTWLTWGTHRQVNAVMEHLGVSRSGALAYVIYRGLSSIGASNKQLEQMFKHLDTELQQDFPMAYARSLAMRAAHKGIDEMTVDDIPF